MPKFSASFTGAVFDVDVSVGGHPVRLSRRGSKWTGWREIDVIGDSVRVEMSFTAPSFTDWALTVKADSKKILEEDGRSGVPSLSLNQLATL